MSRISRISDEARERAALTCQVAASNGLSLIEASRALYGDQLPAPGYLVLMWLGWAPPWVTHAEAECLLRCGWCPGDEVTRV